MRKIAPIVPITMRVPEHIVNWLEKRAVINMRSRHSEMLFILETVKKKEELEGCVA